MLTVRRARGLREGSGGLIRQAVPRACKALQTSRARFYKADLGRFLQTDPIGYEDQNTRSRREAKRRQTSMHMWPTAL